MYGKSSIMSRILDTILGELNKMLYVVLKEKGIF